MEAKMRKSFKVLILLSIVFGLFMSIATGCTPKASKGIKTVWEKRLDSPIYSSPLLEHGNIFIGSEGNVIYCLNAENGNVIWKQSIGPAYSNNSAIRLHSSPAVYQDKIYIHVYDQSKEYLVCLNSENGNLLWKKVVLNIPPDAPYFPMPYSSPATYNGKVYLISSSYIYCFDAKNGKTIWKYKTESPINYFPVFYQNKLCTTLYGTKYIGCFDAENGKLIWKCKLNERASDFFPNFRVAIDNGRVYALSPYNMVYCIDPENGSLLWKKKVASDLIPSFSSMVSQSGKLYIAINDKLYCLDAESGNLIWTYKATPDCFSSPITVRSKQIYLGSNSGALYCINEETGTLLWKFKTENVIASKPLVYEGKIYFGTEGGYVYCISGN